ncbi:MAG: DUF2520 domain-containing protein [Pyrinomonadaceae bacterium]|nr:DUF2520 domain-containing protein [Pyrinomonadaceae bacterium]
MSSTKRTAMTANGAATATRQRRKQHHSQHATTVSIIGAGRLGTALARALSHCGYTIEAVVARSITSARRAARLSGAHPLALTSTQLGQLPASSILFITTPDDCIADTSTQLAAIFRQQQPQRGRIILHASGALSSDALCDLRDVGFATGSLHPLISISDPLKGAESLSEAFYCIEGEPQAVNLARSLVRRLGGQSFSVNTKDKALYHAAAVMASGHMTALFQIATEMLQLCGLSEKRARAVLLPLVRSTIKNLATHTPARALTGTFARADLETMRRHLTALRSQADGEALAAYALLGSRSLQLAGKDDVNKAAAKEMARILEEINS